MARIDQFRTLQIVKALLLYRYLYELSRRQQLNKQVDLEPDPKTASGGYAQKAETPIKRSSPFGGSAISFPANLAKNPRQTIYYYHHDHLGSVRVVTDASGVPVDRYNYFPFGKEINPAANPKTNYKFTGKEHDISTNLDYFGARYYASNLGRFMSADPKKFRKGAIFNPQRWNLYAYTINNPVKYIDPDGREIELAQGLSDKNKNYLIRNMARLISTPAGRAMIDRVKSSKFVFALNVGALPVTQINSRTTHYENGNCNYGRLKTDDGHVVLNAKSADSPSAPAIDVILDPNNIKTTGTDPARVLAHEFGGHGTELINAAESNDAQYIDNVNPKDETASLKAEKDAGKIPRKPTKESEEEATKLTERKVEN